MTVSENNPRVVYGWVSVSASTCLFHGYSSTGFYDLKIQPEVKGSATTQLLQARGLSGVIFYTSSPPIL
jgi:uncharacterized protein YifN (PemK superfamily)